MKTNDRINVFGILIVAYFVASLSVAQDKIADDVLLKMLEGANSGTPEIAENLESPVEAGNPVSLALESVQEAGERVEEADAVVGETAAADAIVKEDTEADTVVEDVVEAVAAAKEGMIDDLGMTSYDEKSSSTADDLISVRLNRVGLEEAINLFAQLSGANIIVPELTEAAQVSVNLKDVEWRPALQSILDSYNYELYQKVSGSNVFSVRRRPAGAPEPQVVETFVLRYATVPNAAALVRELLPENAKISEFASRNMLVVKSTESSLSEVRSILATIDTVRQQVFIESKFMELSDGAQKDLGIDWQMLQSYQAGANALSSTFNKTDNDNTATSRLFDMGGSEVAAVGGAPEYIETFDLVDPYERYQETFPSTTKTTEKTLSQVSTAVLSADDLSLVLSALAENKGANMVSNPKIIVANEEKANISIVRKEPNLKQERQQTGGGDAPIDNITFTLDSEMPFFEYGIKLDVIPSINTSSNITVNINPSLTRWVADKRAGDNSYPIIDEKSIETVFNLSSGQTAAIGGLTEVTDSDIERKVPLLGSIPFLGRLFSWQQTINDQKETVIFVTVSLANTQEIDLETGLPEDSELARRRLIRERNKRTLRKQGREYYQAEEDDKLDDMIKALDGQEAKRVERRAKMLEKEQEKTARNELASS